MAKIAWDQTGEKRFENGVQHGVLYPYNESTNAYDKGVAWNGLTSVSDSPEGAEATDLWADNQKYASMRSAETLGLTIEAYTYPDEFAECDGSVEVAEGVYLGQQKRKKFGFSYRSEVGDDTNSEKGYKLHLVYGCTASPSEKSYETINDSPDAITFSWEIDCTPVTVAPYKPIYSITIDSTKIAAEKLATIEDLLYGSASSEPKLPLPDEIISIMTT